MSLPRSEILEFQLDFHLRSSCKPRRSGFRSRCQRKASRALGRGPERSCSCRPNNFQERRLVPRFRSSHKPRGLGSRCRYRCRAFRAWNPEPERGCCSLPSSFSEFPLARRSPGRGRIGWSSRGFPSRASPAPHPEPGKWYGCPRCRKSKHPESLPTKELGTTKMR